MTLGPSLPYFLPELVLAGAVLVVVFVDLAASSRRRREPSVWPGNLALLAAGAALALTLGLPSVGVRGLLADPTRAWLFNGMVVFDGFGGLASILPVYTGVTGLAFFAAMGLPGLSAFVSEVLVLLGAWKVYPALTVVAASAVILTAGYLLWTLQRMYLGAPNEKYRDLPDINGRELFTLVPLGAIVIFLGVYPTPILNLQGPALLRLNDLVRAATTAPAQEMIAAAPVAHVP